ncbi:MAG: PAS domain S-box protein [Bacteroidota bacterium]
MTQTKREKELLAENEELQIRLAEAEEALRAIRSGEVDALVVSTGDQEHIFTLKGAEQTYRLLVEEMNEGAGTLTADGMILYANHRLAEMLNVSLERLIGTSLQSWVDSDNHERLHNMVQLTLSDKKQRGELKLLSQHGTTFPTLCSFNLLHTDGVEPVISLVVTDMTEQIRLMQLEINERETQARLEESEKARASLLSMLEDQKEIEMALRESEERYRLVIENAVENIFTTDAQGYFQYANAAALKSSGYSVTELQKLRYNDLILPEHRKRVSYTYFRQFLSRQLVSYTEYPFRTKGGEIKWYAQNARLIEENGTITGFHFIARDITEKKFAEEKLQRAERRYREFFENDLTGDYISAPDGRLLDCNPAFLNIFGFKSKEEAFQTNMSALYSSPQERQKFVEQVRKERAIVYKESTARHFDGSPVYIIENALGIFDENEELKEIRGYIFDDTRRKRLEQQLFQTQKMESIGTLAGGIAHDFNNILAIILGHTNIMSRAKILDERLNASLETITKATQRGAALVKQILTFARKSDSVVESVRINDIIKEIVSFATETFPKTINFHLDIDRQLKTINGDYTQIHQVILNLVVNARDAMPNGGTITIATTTVAKNEIPTTFSDEMEDEYIRVSVQDTGTGMDEATKSRIFEPFFTTKEKGKGTGLGLAVVYGVVKSHKGHLTVDSTVGVGTTFHLYFPVPRMVLDFDGETPTTLETVPGGSETILIVEDEEMLRELLKQILESNGYTVFSTGDVDEALSLYTERHHQIALVISDIGLPKRSGFELLLQLKQVNPSIRLIFTSGFLEPQLRSKMLNEGVQHFIEKPYDIKKVTQTVRAALDQEK